MRVGFVFVYRSLKLIETRRNIFCIMSISILQEQAMDGEFEPKLTFKNNRKPQYLEPCAEY
jgi:hypothetical protein